MSESTSELVELLPCPFCDGRATYRWHSEPACWIECMNCFAVGPNDVATTTEENAASWNTRAPLPAPPAKAPTE